MSKSSLFLLMLASTLVQSQVVPSCPRQDLPFCSRDHILDFKDVAASTGVLLTTPSACLASYGKLDFDSFSVFSVPLAGAASAHVAGFQLGAGACRINRGDGMDIFHPRSFDFLCALPTLALGAATSVGCTVRVVPVGYYQEGRSVNCTYSPGGLLSPLVPARCEIPDWGWSIETLTIEVIRPAVLNTLYAFGISNFSYSDDCNE